MSAPLSCCNPCSTVETVNVPGIEGAPGVDGVDGQNAYTFLTADILSFANPVTANVISSVWMVVGQVLIIGDGYPSVGETNYAHFRVSSIPSSTQVVLTYLGYSVDNGDGDGTLLTGCGVSPSGEEGPAGP